MTVLWGGLPMEGFQLNSHLASGQFSRTWCAAGPFALS